MNFVQLMISNTSSLPPATHLQTDLPNKPVKQPNISYSNMLFDNSDFQEALQVWPCFPQKHGYSPAEMFFSGRQQSMLPILHLHHHPNTMKESESKHTHFHPLISAAHDKQLSDFPSLAINQRVLVQHHDTKLWSIKGVVHSILPDSILFIIKLPSDQHITRGRRLIQSRIFNSKGQLITTTFIPSVFHTLDAPPPSQSPCSSPLSTRPQQQIKKPVWFLD